MELFVCLSSYILPSIYGMIHFPVYSLANIFIHKYIRRYIKRVNVTRDRESRNRSFANHANCTCGDSVDTLSYLQTALTHYHTYDL